MCKVILLLIFKADFSFVVPVALPLVFFFEVVSFFEALFLRFLDRDSLASSLVAVGDCEEPSSLLALAPTLLAVSAA